MSGLLDHLAPRKSKATAQKVIVQRNKEKERLIKAYEGGTVAEQQTLKSLLEQFNDVENHERLSTLGRKIDLPAIAAECRENGEPKWCMIDPRAKIDENNGRINQSTGYCKVGGYWINITFGKTRKANLIPKGIPPIPSEVRAILGHPDVVQNARIVGLLFQPEEWLAIRPDPALIVEWKALLGEYYALAVWGQDKPGIMEFVS